MPAFTGKGDNGFTDLQGGKRVRKDHPVVDLVGEIDELSAWIGLARSECKNSGLNDILEQIQKHLSVMMGLISAYGAKTELEKNQVAQSLEMLEKWVNEYEKKIMLPTSFQQAGSSKDGAYLNMVRTISRRIERKAVSIFIETNSDTVLILTYLNRLSTLFYLLWMYADQP